MPETQRRSASTRNLKNGGETSKSFVCSLDGCGKRFTRLEHLNRHALNHTAGEATCDRCRAHFKRPDLLARHMERHKKRDEEAGGAGILKTRKRSWKDPDGTIVDKRPNTLGPSTSIQADAPPHLATVGEEPATAPGPEGPISPPISQQSSDLSFAGATPDHFPERSLGFDQDDLVTSVPLFPSHPPTGHTPGDLFGFIPAIAPDQEALGNADALYYEAFQPDTASSFNMPYTTATNYNWLFDLNTDLGVEDMWSNSVQDQPSSSYSEPPFNASTDMEHVSTSHSAHGKQVSRPEPMSLESPAFGSHDNNASEVLMFSVHGPSSIDSSEEQSATLVSSVHVLTNAPIRQAQNITSEDPIEPERPLSMLRRPQSLPCMDECTRESVMDLVEFLRPASPNNGPITRDNKNLTMSSLQAYLDLFFTRFNTAYPLIHQATFVASKVDPLLLLAMLLLGATYSSKTAHQLAVCIHDVMRPAIFSHASFSARPELWVLETVLLVECFGKSRAGQKQHDMSHLFHGLLINLIRRSDCQTVQPIGPDKAGKSDDDLEVAWGRWVEAEQKKRLALLCFLWDTQHAVLFCQSLCMSSFELRLPLPSSQALWEAQTALEWKSHGSSYTQEPQFLPTLKSYLAPSTPRPASLNSLSLVLILHGLMSIFWDMQRRDQTSLGVIPGAAGNAFDTWRDRLARAYDLWKVDFDKHCEAVSARYAEGNARQEFAVFTTSYNAVYHCAQVLLNADFLDLQIYAGARHILGKPVQRSDYVRSERIVKNWAASTRASRQSLSAAQAAWHAATLLRDASQNLDNFDSMGLFHVPWCLYLATLTCWAFHHSGQSHSGSDRDQGMVWDARAEMRSVVANMANCATPREVALGQGNERTAGLVWVMVNALERVRWGIIHSGVTVLRGLVPWRLINQYEGA